MGISLFCQLGGLHETRICFSGREARLLAWGVRWREFGEARAVFGAVDDALDQKVSQQDGPEADAENAQPALMAVSMAVVTVLAENGVVKTRPMLPVTA